MNAQVRMLALWVTKEHPKMAPLLQVSTLTPVA